MSKKRLSDADRDNEQQILLFEKFLDCVESGHQVRFTQTETSLDLVVEDYPDPYYEDRQKRVRLIKRNRRRNRASRATFPG